MTAPRSGDRLVHRSRRRRRLRLRRSWRHVLDELCPPRRRGLDAGLRLALVATPARGM